MIQPTLAEHGDITVDALADAAPGDGVAAAWSLWRRGGRRGVDNADGFVLEVAGDAVE